MACARCSVAEGLRGLECVQWVVGLRASDLSTVGVGGVMPDCVEVVYAAVHLQLLRQVTAMAILCNLYGGKRSNHAEAALIGYSSLDSARASFLDGYGN